MISTTADDDCKRLALNNASRSLDFDRRLPERVFSVDWSRFRFFQSDRLFVGKFIVALHDLLATEGGTTGCLVNLSETRSFSQDEVAAWFLDTTTMEDEFVTRLRGDNPAEGWLYAMDRYVCASDVGQWCIYSEKENDIAVIGFHDDKGLNDFRQTVEDLQALSLDTIEDVSSGPFPFNSLTLAWREALKRHYKETT